MSGSFVDAKYQSTLVPTDIYSILVQPETLQATIDGTANTSPTGEVNQKVSMKVSKTRREIGASPHKVALRFTGTIPDGYSGGDVIIPALSNSFKAAAVNKATGTYLGAAVKVIYTVPENFK